MEKDIVDFTCNYFGILQACLTYSRTAHWITKGEAYYADHLMFERIYNELNELQDSFAEKAVAHFSEHSIDPIKFTKVLYDLIKELKPEPTPKDLIDNLIKFIKLSITSIDELYAILKKENKLTMGLDDLLMAMCNTHEHHLYLLGQRIAK